MLNTTKVEIELILDADICSYLNLFQMQRGVSYISKKYNKANNKYLKSSDSRQEQKHIVYLVENNLYGYDMSNFLLTGGFKWIDPNIFELNKYSSNSSKGCVLEVDLEYPKELCELHNDHHLTTDKIEIEKERLFNYQL